MSDIPEYVSVAPDVIPDLPEHVRPTDADESLAKHGVVWCFRCGRVIENISHEVKQRDCQVVPVTFRGDDLFF